LIIAYLPIKIKSKSAFLPFLLNFYILAVRLCAVKIIKQNLLLFCPKTDKEQEKIKAESKVESKKVFFKRKIKRLRS